MTDRARAEEIAAALSEDAQYFVRWLAESDSHRLYSPVAELRRVRCVSGGILTGGAHRVNDLGRAVALILNERKEK